MITQICIFNVFSTICALFCFRSTYLKMFINFLKIYRFLTKFALDWFLCTILLMIVKNTFHCCKSTLFTFNFSMFFGFMFLFVCLCNTLITRFTFIILSRTTYIMHSEPGDFNFLGAYSA